MALEGLSFVQRLQALLSAGTLAPAQSPPSGQDVLSVFSDTTNVPVGDTTAAYDRNATASQLVDYINSKNSAPSAQDALSAITDTTNFPAGDTTAAYDRNVTATQLVTYLKGKNPVSAPYVATDSTGALIAAATPSGSTAYSIAGFASPTWINQSTATAVDDAATIGLRVPGNSAGGVGSVRGRVISAGTGSKTWIARLRFTVPQLSYWMGGMLVQSSGGSLRLFGVLHVNDVNPFSELMVLSFTNPTTEAAGLFEQPWNVGSADFRTKIVRDASNLSYLISQDDGRNWTLLYQEALTTFTPSNVGIGVNANVNSTVNPLSFLSGMLTLSDWITLSTASPTAAAVNAGL
jgi:hypothetical protein